MNGGEGDDMSRRLMMMFGGAMTAEQRAARHKEVVEARRAQIGLAEAALPLVLELRRAARELDAFYADAPARIVALETVPEIRKSIALMVEELEGIVERKGR